MNIQRCAALQITMPKHPAANYFRRDAAHDDVTEGVGCGRCVRPDAKRPEPVAVAVVHCRRRRGGRPQRLRTGGCERFNRIRGGCGPGRKHQQPAAAVSVPTRENEKRDESAAVSGTPGTSVERRRVFAETTARVSRPARVTSYHYYRCCYYYYRYRFIVQRNLLCEPHVRR